VAVAVAVAVGRAAAAAEAADAAAAGADAAADPPTAAGAVDCESAGCVTVTPFAPADDLDEL
jgi:hypothetical protein